MGWIYKITSPIGKCYCGQTWSKNPYTRWTKHKNKKWSGCRAVRNAIIYYGAENMLFEPLYEISYKTHGYRWKEFLNFWEIYEIAEEDTLSPNGYNLHPGGKNHAMSEETKQILREKAIGRMASEETRLKLKKTPEQRKYLSLLKIGTKQTQEAKNKISAWGKGRPKSEEHKAKIKAGQPEYTEERRQATVSFNKKTKTKRVYQYTKKGVFIKSYESLKIASQETGLSYNGISNCARGKPKNPTCGGFIWKFTESSGGFSTEERKTAAKKVDQFTLEGIFIKTHSSATAAASELNITPSNIGKCCKGKQKTAGGYTWKFSMQSNF
jgi:group I intron endonuclease